MTSRFRMALVLGSLTLAGCSDAFNAGPMRYVPSGNAKLLDDLKDKPKLRAAVGDGLVKLFGKDPQDIHVPPGAPIPLGGVRLANYRALDDGPPKQNVASRTIDPGLPPVVEPIEGGYGLYRKHCLHCHGVSGAGDGPTAPFLYPRPRDYRKGTFKFTRTATGAKPTRDDLRKTIHDGLHGSSMPAFSAMLNPFEIDQVVDYVIFLSLRGEVEEGLLIEATIADESDSKALDADVLKDVSSAIFKKWKDADGLVLNPPVPRTRSTAESILRGREKFLGGGPAASKVDCIGCHGAKAQGDGASIIRQEVFNDVVFGGDPSARAERMAAWKAKDPGMEEKLKKSLDDWGDPIRPANLNRGVYKGGRRPIDIYWRIAKGINGTPMPGHATVLKPEEIWDIVNFVLILPYEPRLLEDATLTVAPTAVTAR